MISFGSSMIEVDFSIFILYFFQFLRILKLKINGPHGVVVITSTRRVEGFPGSIPGKAKSVLSIFLLLFTSINSNFQIQMQVLSNHLYFFEFNWKCFKLIFY